MTLSISGCNKVVLSVGNGAKEAAASAVSASASAASAATSASNASASASAAAASAAEALGYTATAGGDLDAEIARALAAEALLAPKNSPTFTGTPTVPTAAAGTNTTQAASTAFVMAGLTSKAPLASPALTGTPTAPTAAIGTNSTQIATTEFATTLGNRVFAASSILLASVSGADTITASHYPAASGVTPAQSGQIYVMRKVGTNTTSAVTLAVGGGAALPVYDAHGAALSAGDLQAGAYIILACINGTSYRVISSLMTPAEIRAEVARLDASIAAETARSETEESALWDRQSDSSKRIAPVVTLPSLPIGLREVEPTEVSYDLCVTEGRWADTGLPWTEDGRYDGLVLLPRTITNDVGAVIEVTLWSFDLCPLAGYYVDTGAIWSSSASDILPEMVVETSTNEVVVYYKSGAANLPTYIRHRMERYTDPARNIDVWRTDQPSEARRRSDGTFETVQRIIQNSEVDTAIQLTGRIDFAGGKIHGNEEMTRPAVWMVDGVQIDPSEGITYAPHRVELIQTTRLYDPGSSLETQYSPKGSAFVELTKRHRWENGEYGIRTHVRELYSNGLTTILYGFFLMVPIMRLDTADGTTQITHTATRSPYYDNEDVSVELFTKIESTSDRVIVWGDRYSAEWYAIEGWSDPSRKVYVDNRTNYNKIYPGFFRNSTYAMTGAEYDVESAFRLNIKESV